MRDRGPLPWPEAGFLLETVALTLADCHREGIVHRDVKPGNVMLTRHLHPRLADFGIALPLNMATSPATVAYTPSYSPPEAYEPGVAAPTIDVFGLGATLWALLAGRAPDQEGIRVEPVRADVPPALADLIERAMDPDPARRPPDAAAFATELRRATRLAGPDDGPGQPDQLGGLPGSRVASGSDVGPGAEAATASSRPGPLRGRLGLLAIGTALAGGAMLVAAGLWSLLA
jgi:serine/threonine protein kinase